MRIIDFTVPENNESACYAQIAALQNDIVSAEDNRILVRILSDKEPDRTTMFLLCTLPLLAKRYEKRVHLFLAPNLIELAKKMDIVSFYKSFDEDAPMEKSDSAFRQLETVEDIFEIVAHITKEAPIKVSDVALDILVSKMGEIYLNARDHSETTWIVGGKYFKSEKTYCFCCYDAGIGIPQKVNQFLTASGKPPLSGIDALKWAMAEGHSTAPADEIPRGAGFQTLHNFARANKGKIRICSGNIHYVFQNGVPMYQKLDSSFVGTMFEMEIIADNKHKYILQSEVSK